MLTKSLTESDQKRMELALQLAEQARYHAPPNPWVGCVIVKDERVVGQGFTQAVGGPHAEVMALRNAGDKAQGATAYTTLEPCAHHGNTPPCCAALVQAKVKRVVVATCDEDKRVKGKGIDYLKEHGVEVTLGVAEEPAQQLLAPYLHQRRTGSAYCVLKAALSADGRSSAADGSSQWISGVEARCDAHHLRDLSGAVVVGSGTALADKPALNVRHITAKSPRPPLRVLLDGTGRVPADGPLFDRNLGPTLVFTSTQCSPTARQEWETAGAEVCTVGTDAGRLKLKEVLAELGSREILQALFEGGASIAHSLIQEGLVGQLSLYIGPCLLGAEGSPLLNGPSPKSINHAPRLALKHCTRLGDSVRLDYKMELS